ncbi:MAG: porin [Gammaproteobacteria bacterium]|nr:porin [Gammaproteobacteria bacterium]
MKKTAIALAVAAIVSAPAMAEVKVSGNAVYLIKSSDDGVAGNASATTDSDGEFAVSDDDTDFDINVTVDLNGGWTGGLSMDLEGATKDLDINNVSMSHDTYGKITVGGAVYTGTTGRLGAALDGDIELAGGDSLSYSNTFGGLTAGLSVDFSGDKSQAMGVGATYTAGDLKVGAGYATISDVQLRGTTFGDSAAGLSIDQNAAASFAFDPVTGGTTAVAAVNNPSTDATYMTVGASYSMGAISAGAHLETGELAPTGAAHNPSFQSTGISVGYKLSDVTSLSLGATINDFEATKDDKTNDNTDVTLGVTHTMGAVELAASYGMTTYEATAKPETQGELDVSAKYNFGNGFYAKAAVDMTTSKGGVKSNATNGTDVTTTELSFGGKF